MWCYFYIIFFFYLFFYSLHCPLSRPDLTYISLLIIPCIIYHVTNKETLNLERNVSFARTFESCSFKVKENSLACSLIDHFLWAHRSRYTEWPLLKIIKGVCKSDNDLIQQFKWVRGPWEIVLSPQLEKNLEETLDSNIIAMFKGPEM